MARSKKKKAEINASSMADIAFLLLIFFLVTTTIDTDKGIAIRLPPMPEEEQDDPIKLRERNVLKILVNAGDQILFNGEPTGIRQLKNKAQDFIDNSNRQNRPDYSISPQKAVISLKNDRGTSYEMYIAVQNELKSAYNELRNAKAMREHGETYDDLVKRGEDGDTWAKDRALEIRKYYKQVISEAEPEDVGGS